MILPMKIQADWQRIHERRQAEIIRNNNSENKGRLEHQYQVGEKVLLQKPGILRKLSTPREGPYEIVQVYDNGTVQIQRNAVREKVNIRRIIPFRNQEQE